MWYTVPVNGTEKPLHYAYRKQVYRGENGEVFISCPGEHALLMARLFGPGPDELRRMLRELRTRWSWPQALLAAVLGVPKPTLRRWEDGTRNPCGAAKKLIWLMHATCVKEEQFVNLYDIVSWGYGDKTEFVFEE